MKFDEVTRSRVSVEVIDGNDFFLFCLSRIENIIVLKYEMTFEIVTEKSIDAKYN